MKRRAGAVALLLFSHHASAQLASGAETSRSVDGVFASAPEPRSSSMNGVVPPRLLGSEPVLQSCGLPFVDAVLTVGRDGEVSDVAVVADVGEHLAGLVRNSLFALRFAPALRNGEPNAAKITYRMRCVDDEPESGAAARLAPEPRLAALTLPVDAAQEPKHERSSPVAGAGTGIDDAPLEVVVQGPSAAERLQRGANAVSVVELTTARQRTGSLGEVLARQEGASVRTMGGLGGFTRFSLDGLSNEQVRFFIDGVPLRYAGYSLGVANVPLEQLEHIEIHHGVVPARLGADALGGAVNLSTVTTRDGSRAGGSVSTGSFGTTRLAASAVHRDGSQHYMVQVNAFRDRADNDYTLRDVPVLDARGRVSHTSRPHFHNAYAADGVGLELGVVEMPWAKHLVLRGFFTDHHKEIPHDDVGLANQNPYGEVTYGRTAAGLLLTHQVVSERVRIDTRVGFTNERLTYKDVARCSYDWFGRCVIERRSRGEVSAVPVDAKISDRHLLARIDGSWLVHPQHELRASVAPTSSSRRGKDEVLLEHVPDPLAAKRRFTTAVVGLDYEFRETDGVWTNDVFTKWYGRHLDARETLPNGNRRDWDQLKTYGGFGDALRFDLSERVYAKASYEYAVRFPSLEEIFGDGSQVVDNLELAAERSHNVNVELHGAVTFADGGEASAYVRGFGRFLNDRIWLQAVTGYSIYDNIAHSRVLGGEGMVQWTAPEDWLQLMANGTWIHSRDTSGEQAVRLPSDPWFWANAQATLSQSQILNEHDSVGFDWNVGYVHGFPLSTGQRGDAATRLRVDAQTVHTCALRYALTTVSGSFSAAAEVNNAFDALVMDFYGVQRPGRAFFLKFAFRAERTSNDKGQ